MELLIGTIVICCLVAILGFFLFRSIFAAKMELLVSDKNHLLAENEKMHLQIIELEKMVAVFQTEKKLLNEKIGDQGSELKKIQEQFAMQFENLANRIFEQKSNQFVLSSEKSISGLLSPLKEKIAEFQVKIEDTYSNESRERFALKGEIDRLVTAHQEVTKETNSLTQALRGDVKAMGTWGEVVLERILEASALRPDEEYTVQGKGMGLVDDGGKRQQPDIVINLPDDRHIIVDSKVSLVHYERFIEGEAEERESNLKLFVNSINSHIDSLSGKKYHLNEKLVTPDFVLMFIPIEGALSLALQDSSKLLMNSWEKSVVVVGPTTLLATLRTISSIWKQERQTKNALKIAREGGLLYDKFASFIDDLEKVGNSIKTTEGAYMEAMNKLKNGRGNLISKVEKLKTLGVKASKAISKNLLEEEHVDS